MTSTRFKEGSQDLSRSDAGESRRMKQGRGADMAASQEALDKTNMAIKTISAPSKKDGCGAVRAEDVDPKKRGNKATTRWDPKHFFEAPTFEQAPLQKEEGEAWNSRESVQVQGEIKGQDRLMRSVRRPEDVKTPDSDAGGRHPLSYDNPEYYPGRSLIDKVSEDPSNDFQVRPVHMPDFYNPPPAQADPVARMVRLRDLMKQRYAGRPKLMSLFRASAIQKPGFIFPRDLQVLLDNMGMHVTEDECDLLVKSVDKDVKGAVTFEEFSNLIYGQNVVIGSKDYRENVVQNHMRGVTKTLVDNLVANGQTISKAFCALDPERRYVVSKQQFSSALASALNGVSNQAIDFLWASQFPGETGQNLDENNIDWRHFMTTVANFAADNRAPTPCCLQGRKRQYDLLQRTAALTGGELNNVDFHWPDQNKDDEVFIVADKLVQRPVDLANRPRDAALLTEHYVEALRHKAGRVERSLPQRIPKARMRELLRNRQNVQQDELIDLICSELAAPMGAAPLQPQPPLYSGEATVQLGTAEVMTLDPKTLVISSLSHEAAHGASPQPFAGPDCLKLVRGDIEAYIATQKANRDFEVDASNFISNLYRPPDEKKSIEIVNDGLNRAIRGNRPPRERPLGSPEAPIYQNYWQARYMMEALTDAMAAVENSNGGKIKASKVFKRLDFDNDGYLSLSDLKTSFEKYNVPASSADLHALMSELDKKDNGSVDIGEFTRNFQMHQGSMLENMQKPIRAVYHEGGVDVGGPLQEQLDAKEQERMAALNASFGPGDTASRAASKARSSSAPPSADLRAGSTRSQMSRTGANIATPIYETQMDLLTGRARVSDVIRARCSAWKPQKAELYTALPKTRFGMTMYPDTRYMTEPSVPLAASYLPEAERFKTTNSVHSIFTAPDASRPQIADAMRKHASNEFRVERIRQRQRDFQERCWAANESAHQFDELKIARKALNQLNYERKVSCAT